MLKPESKYHKEQQKIRITLLTDFIYCPEVSSVFTANICLMRNNVCVVL